jgi:transcriptional regulator with XRE-family HTH domain
MEAQDYVRELLASGMTQMQIAEKTGIPQPTISKVFRGDVADVLSRNYRRLQALHKLVTRNSKRRKAVRPAAKPAEEVAES